MDLDRNSVSRAFAALPDAVTAATFALMWIAPNVLGPGAIRNATLVMLIEFLIVHSAGFVGSFALDERRSSASRVASILGFSLLYLGFVAAFAWIFGEWWPFLAFGWLLLSRIAVALERDPSSARKRARLGAGWVMAVIAYVVGAMLTVVLPIPRLGITEAVQAQIGAPGSGLWIEQPQRVIAFGLLYFGVLGWARWKGWDERLAQQTPAGRRGSRMP